MKKTFILCVILISCSSCSEFALLASGSSIAMSQNTYAKLYNGADILTIMSTEKSMKGHAYDNIKKVVREQTLKNIKHKQQKLLVELEQLKEGKKYIYDKTWGITHD